MRRCSSAFEKRKNYLTRNYLHDFDRKLTGGKINKLTKLSGGFKIDWRPRLSHKWAYTAITPRSLEDFRFSAPEAAGQQLDVTMSLSSSLINSERKPSNYPAMLP